MKTISLLGSTGSIGRQTLDVCRALNFPVCSLTAHSNVVLLESQVREFKPRVVAVADENKYSELKLALADTNVKVLAGQDGIVECATVVGASAVVNAIVGIAGLVPTLAAIEAGKDIALANKETLVTGGELVMPLAREKGVKILPVDSEHCAIFMSLAGHNREDLNKIYLTASGGPFFGQPQAALQNITPKEALNHPTWNMGRKISIDSATLMNKGLELIEAVRLFEVTPEQVEVVVHRQSLLHSAVEYRDGTVIAQLSPPDMRLPIQYCLTYPAHVETPASRPTLSLADYGNMTFERPDEDTFKCLALARRAISNGGLYPTILNAANEAAVELFLNEKISFLGIGDLVESALEHYKQDASLMLTLENILKYDKLTRELCQSLV
jgi:1-deoxy-D-xylulose 5-phosphate reductoisomerase